MRDGRLTEGRLIGEHCIAIFVKNYSAPRLNGQRLSSHFSAVKAGRPFIRTNLMQIGLLVFEKTGRLTVLIAEIYCGP